jgi:predicted amidophosphoribosyltransferase
MSRALHALVALVAPPSCVSCRAPTGVGERLCAHCTRALPWLRRTCPRCALPSHGGRACPAGGAAFSRAWAPLAYEGVARDLVAALKFRGALPVADLMAAHMAANLPPDVRRALLALPPAPPSPRIGAAPPAGSWPAIVGAAPPAGWSPAIVGAAPPAGGAPPAGSSPAIVGGPGVAADASPPGGSAGAVIVPVPTVAARRRRRGFDPAVVLGEALARRLGSPLVACLERRDRTARQVGASRRVRRASGRLAFVVRAPPRVALLVDDVYTTGATLNAAARALADAGTTVFAALAYARTL